MKKILFFLFSTAILISCKKEPSSSDNTSGETVLTVTFRGKTHSIKGYASNGFGTFVTADGVEATVQSASVSPIGSNITDVFSAVALYAHSKDIEVNLGASKRGVPVGDYSYSKLYTDINDNDVYLGVCHSAIFASQGLTVVLSLPDEIVTTITDFTDGNKEYVLVPESATLKVTKADAKVFSGSFSLNAMYGTTVEKVTGTFTVYK